MINNLTLQHKNNENELNIAKFNIIELNNENNQLKRNIEISNMTIKNAHTELDNFAKELEIINNNNNKTTTTNINIKQNLEIVILEKENLLVEIKELNENIKKVQD